MTLTTLHVPPMLRQLTNGKDFVQLSGADVQEVLLAFSSAYPEAGRRVLDESGTVRRFVNVYLDGQDVRAKDGLQTAVPSGSALTVLISVAGG